MKDKNKKVVEIYDQIAEQYAANYDQIDGEEDLIFPRTFLSYLRPKSRILDIGCGTGFSVGWFIENGMEAEGIDLSSSMIKIAKRNYPQTFFQLADMRTFKPSERPDAVWAGYTLFHLEQEDFEKTLDNIRSYLKKDSVFALVMQEGSGEVEIPEPFKPDEKTYIHLYTLDELSEILKKHGFEVLEHKRKSPIHPNELNFNKLLLITRRR